MFFLIFSNADIPFSKQELIYSFYTTAKALTGIKKVELINKKEFIKTVFDKNSVTFVIYIAFLSVDSNSIYIDKKAQIAF